MNKYLVKYIPTYGTPEVSEVVEADSELEAGLKTPKYFKDKSITSITLIK